MPNVRDRNDVKVMKDTKSGVIFLSKTNHIDDTYYSDKSDLSYWNSSNRAQALHQTFSDDQRRADQFKSHILGKKWLDIGSGAGGILDLLVDSAAQLAAVKPQKGIRKELLKYGYNVYKDISDVSDNSFEIITLFHVLEHFTNPVKSLQEIAAKIEKGGKIIIEVPHANDVLLSWFDLESFKEFTFWSEHLILHTRQSPKVFLENSGFINISIKGIQRYSLANHLYWISRGKPNGHNRWSHLSTKALENAYANMLASLDCTDTLLAITEREVNQ